MSDNNTLYVDVSGANYSTEQEMIETLRENGFTVEYTGGNAYTVIREE